MGFLKAGGMEPGGNGRDEGGETYTAPPRKVVVIVSALVKGNEQVGALVAVGEREFGRAHLGSCGFCFRHTGRLSALSSSYTSRCVFLFPPSCNLFPSTADMARGAGEEPASMSFLPVVRTGGERKMVFGGDATYVS